MLLNRPFSLSAIFPQFSSRLLATFCGTDGIEERGNSSVQETGPRLQASSMRAKSSRCERAGPVASLAIKYGLAMTESEKRQDSILYPFLAGSLLKKKQRRAAGWSGIGAG